MFDSKAKKIVIFTTLSLLIGLFAHFSYKKWSKIRQEEQRRAQIASGVKAFFVKCDSIDSFDKRRECFKQDLVAKRAENKQVALQYQMEIQGKLYTLNSEDLGDLVKIDKPQNYALIRCIANTFFFDWNERFVFLSLDNPYGSVSCRLAQGGEIFIFPANLSEETRKMIKSTLLSPIK